jgi:hypothetical protein
MAKITLARRFRRAHVCQAISQELTEDATMPQVKQASKQKRTTKAAAVKVLGAAGLSFSLVGNASASTMPTAGIPQSDNTLGSVPPLAAKSHESAVVTLRIDTVRPPRLKPIRADAGVNAWLWDRRKGTRSIKLHWAL